MANLIEYLRKLIAPYYKYILIAVVFAIFVYVGNYAYNQYYLKPSQNKIFSDVANANKRTEVIIYFFHVDWCPHCKKAQPEWDKFVNHYNGKEVNGYIINCKDVDCTKETSEVTRVINQYKIESYPTVKMIKDEKTIEFDARINQHTLDQFVETMLNN
jgi:thiol-disulfide isomerase/thioredoxin|uniref:Thioredoxin domain-containing protein n=1 Tax=viral metagenome TaxID=1070528 RepID=A0A6C0ATF5_9ZZZZ